MFGLFLRGLFSIAGDTPGIRGKPDESVKTLCVLAAGDTPGIRGKPDSHFKAYTSQASWRHPRN